MIFRFEVTNSGNINVYVLLSVQFSQRMGMGHNAKDDVHTDTNVTCEQGLTRKKLNKLRI